MERPRGGDCEANVHNTRVLAEWINEIHRWGVTVHGPACKDEIKVGLQQSGARTSIIGGATGVNKIDEFDRNRKDAHHSALQAVGLI